MGFRCFEWNLDDPNPLVQPSMRHWGRGGIIRQAEPPLNVTWLQPRSRGGRNPTPKQKTPRKPVARGGASKDTPELG